MNLKENTKEVLSAVVPIVIIVVILNFIFIKLPAEQLYNFIGGAILLTVGFILFLTGIKLSFLPLGEMIGSKLAAKGKLWLMLIFGFLLGFAISFAEPTVQVLANQVELVSSDINRNVIILSISLGLGIFLMFAVLRIFLQIKIEYLLLGGYIVIFILGCFTPNNFYAISFDAAGSTTGPLTVPFIISLGVGIGAVAKEKNETDSSFGLVSIAAMGPIIAVMLLGVIYS